VRESGFVVTRMHPLPDLLWTFGPVTLTFTRWPSYTNLTSTARGDTPCVQWTSYVRAFDSYRLTDRQTDRQNRPKLYMKHARRGCSKISGEGLLFTSTLYTWGWIRQRYAYDVRGCTTTRSVVAAAAAAGDDGVTMITGGAQSRFSQLAITSDENYRLQFTAV